MSAEAHGVEQIGDCLLLRPEAVRDALFAWGRALDVVMATPQMRQHVRRLEAQRQVARIAFESRASDRGHADVAKWGICENRLQDSTTGLTPPTRQDGWGLVDGRCSASHARFPRAVMRASSASPG